MDRPVRTLSWNGKFPVHGWISHGPLYEHAPKTASEIDFGLVSRGSLIALAKDLGTFSRGAQIDHEFSVDPEIFPIGTAFPYCAVMRVKYADGTQWRNPDPPQP